MGLFDNLVSGQQAANTNAPNTDPVGSYIGNLIDPATAEQYQQARAMQGLLGFFAGAGAASGPSRMPITSGSMLSQGLMNMMQQQNALPGQALQAAQTAGQIGDAQYKKLQGLGLLQNMQFLNQQAKAAQDAYANGGNASTTGGTVSPTNPSASSLSADYADKVIGVESGGNPNAKNPRSSATGPGGFIDSTWLDLYRKTHPGAASVGDDASLLALRTDPQTARGMIDAYGDENTPILAQAGLPINDATLYSAHFLGPDGAVKVLTAPASTPLSSLLSAKAMAANPNLKGKTAADFASMMSSKMGVNSAVGSSYASGSGAPGSPVQLASMNGSAGPDNAAFLAKAFGGQGQAAAPGGLQTSSMAAPPGVNAPQVGGSMPLPPGVTQQQVNAARLANSFATMRGGTPDPYLAGLGIYGLDTSKAAANAQAEQAARAGWAGVRAYNTKAGEAPFNMDRTITVPDGQGGLREIAVPLTTYMQILQQQGLTGGAPQAAPSMPSSVPSMPGTNLGSGGVLRAPNAPAPTPPQMSPPSGLVPGGAMPGLRPSPAPASGPPVPMGGNPAPMSPGAPAGSNGPPAQSSTYGVPLIGKPILNPTSEFNPYGYSFRPQVGQGPGQTEPIVVPPSKQLPIQTTIPPLSSAPPITGSQKDIEGQSANATKTLEGWNKAQAAAPNAIQRVEAIGNVLKYYQSGAWSEHISDVLANLKAAGIPVSSDNLRDPAKMEQILKNNFGAALATMQATGLSRWTQNELLASQKNFANPGLQPAANFEILSQNLGNLYQQQAVINAWNEARKQGWPADPNLFEQQWLKDNPLESFIDAAKVRVGPLVGMSKEEVTKTMPKVIQNPKSGQVMMHSQGNWVPIAPLSYEIVGGR